MRHACKWRTAGLHRTAAARVHSRYLHSLPAEVEMPHCEVTQGQSTRRLSCFLRRMAGWLADPGLTIITSKFIHGRESPRSNGLHRSMAIQQCYYREKPIWTLIDAMCEYLVS